MPLLHENKFVTDFKEKAELFNTFFAKQLFKLQQNSFASSLFEWQSSLSSASFSQNNIGKIFQNLYPNKAHGHDNISICMLTIYVQ